MQMANISSDERLGRPTKLTKRRAKKRYKVKDLSHPRQIHFKGEEREREREKGRERL